MSKGISYLAAYRMTQANQMNQAYKQAIMELQSEQQRMQAYQQTIQNIDKSIASYEKLLQKITEEGSTSASRNEILDAEIALSNIYAKNASNQVAIYRYADEVFDAPNRTSAEIQSLGSQRSPYYNATQIGNLQTHLSTPAYKNVFADLTPEQTQDAAIKLYDSVQAEAAAGLGRPLNNSEKRGIASAIANSAGISVAKMTRTAHQQAKQDYIDNAQRNASGNTSRLENAINTARNATPQTEVEGTGRTALEEAMLSTAGLIAADGVIGDEDDQALLIASLRGLYDNPEAIINYIDADGVEKRKKYKDFDDDEEFKSHLKLNNIPSTTEELFRQRVVAGSREVQEARQVGRINRNINLLQQERAAAAEELKQAQEDFQAGLTPENLRERQAELFAQTLSPQERERMLTPEQRARIERLEAGATTKAERQMEAEDPLAGMSQDEVNVKRAMAAAILARQEGKELKLNETEEDSYRALKDLLDSGAMSKQDVYAKSLQLANQMGGLPEARRSFAQSVASRIYLDLYDEQKAQQIEEAGAEPSSKGISAAASQAAAKGVLGEDVITDRQQPTEIDVRLGESDFMGDEGLLGTGRFPPISGF